VPVWVHVWTMCAIAVPICALLTIFGDRVTTAVHSYEHHYCLTHRCHFHFRFHRRPMTSPAPSLLPSP